MKKIAMAFAIVSAAAVGPMAARSLDAAAERAAIDAELATIYPDLDALYQDVHLHPELGFHEERTASVLAAKMRELGFEVTEHVGRTGVVAIYHNGPGPVVADGREDRTSVRKSHPDDWRRRQDHFCRPQLRP
jgi:hypothetical protein